MKKVILLVAGVCCAVAVGGVVFWKMNAQDFEQKANKPIDKPKVNLEVVSIQAAVRASLKDPESAQFGALTIAKDRYACLTVNARNSYGGYSGPREAALTKVADGSWQVMKIYELVHPQCVDAIQKMADAPK